MTLALSPPTEPLRPMSPLARAAAAAIALTAAVLWVFAPGPPAAAQEALSRHGLPTLVLGGTGAGLSVYSLDADGQPWRWQAGMATPQRLDLGTGPAGAAGLMAASDDNVLLVLSADRRSLQLHEAPSGRLLHHIPVKDEAGPAAATQLLRSDRRQSFLILTDRFAELWEIPWSEKPPFRGWVHDWRDDGPPAVPRFPLRRIPLPGPLSRAEIAQDGEHVAALLAGPNGAPGAPILVDLYIGRVVARSAE